MKLFDNLKIALARAARRFGFPSGLLDPSIRYCFLAYRGGDTDGWTLEEIRKPFDKAVAKVLSTTFDLVELHFIPGGARRASVTPPKDRQLGNDVRANIPGWMRDVAAGCWRAPGELLSRLPGSPVHVSELRVSFSPPDAGWLRFGLLADSHAVEIVASTYDDPFPDMVRWLERLAKDDHSRCTIDSEDRFFDLHSYPAGEQKLMRLVVTHERRGAIEGERDKLFDIEIDRVYLVERFYVAMVQFWMGDGFLKNRFHWSSDDPEVGFHAADFGDFRSAFLDRKFGFDL